MEFCICRIDSTEMVTNYQVKMISKNLELLHRGSHIVASLALKKPKNKEKKLKRVWHIPIVSELSPYILRTLNYSIILYIYFSI